ncbi:hypothetical protein ACFE04_018076 [Oxalis oulophora]
MGTIISKAANGIGGVLGNAFVAPFKNIFGASCEEVCAGPWDLVCFIEHLCVSNLVKLLLMFALCFILLMFCYLLFKIGICQCIVKSICKMCWAGCMTYWYALEDITCCLWYKLKNTKRVNRRRRFKDIERGYSSSTTSESEFSTNLNLSRKRKLTRESKGRHNRHHVKLKTREVSIRVKGRSSKRDNSRRMQLISKVRNPRKEIGFIKRRRLE